MEAKPSSIFQSYIKNMRKTCYQRWNSLVILMNRIKIKNEITMRTATARTIKKAEWTISVPHHYYLHRNLRSAEVENNDSLSQFQVTCLWLVYKDEKLFQTQGIVLRAKHENRQSWLLIVRNYRQRESESALGCTISTIRRWQIFEERL